MTVHYVTVKGEHPVYLTMHTATLFANADVIVGDFATMENFHQSIGHNAEQIAFVEPATPQMYLHELDEALSRHGHDKDAVLIRLAGDREDCSVEVSDLSARGVDVEVTEGAGEIAPEEGEYLVLPRTGPLVGVSVAIVRARHQASLLGDLLLQAGARSTYVPVIEIVVSSAARACVEEAISEDHPEWVIFTSQNAVASVLDLAAGRTFVNRALIACVGEATKDFCLSAGIHVDFIPSTSNTAALVAEFPATPASAKVTYFAGENAGSALETGLRSRGHEVHRVNSYSTVPAKVSPYVKLRAHGAEAIAFTSASTVEGAIAALGEDHLPKRKITIGPVTSAALRAHGIAITAEAPDQNLKSLVETIIDSFNHPVEA